MKNKTHYFRITMIVSITAMMVLILAIIVYEDNICDRINREHLATHKPAIDHTGNRFYMSDITDIWGSRYITKVYYNPCDKLTRIVTISPGPDGIPWTGDDIESKTEIVKD